MIIMQPYVYELIDPRTSTVFYVGKGRKDRINAHERKARKGEDSEKCRVIRDVEAAGLVIQKRVVARFNTDAEAFQFEAELIEQYGLENLTNAIPGGGKVSAASLKADDKSWALVVAEFFNRTRGGRIKTLLVAGQPLDLTKIAQEYTERLTKIIERRGLDWVNSLAARFHVRFANG